MSYERNSKQKLFFAHSAGPQYGPGKGSYDLVKYLKVQLKKNYKILFPIIKRPNSPTYEKYKQMYKQAMANISEPIILVGHSLGGSTLLKYLSEDKPGLNISALFLVATPHWKSNMKEFELKKNFQTSLTRIPKIFLYHSKEDTDVPIENLHYYENAFKNAIVYRLNGNEHSFSNGLPELVSDINSLKR